MAHKRKPQRQDGAPTAPGVPQVLTPQQVADRLQIPLSAVYEKTRYRADSANPLPVHKIGKYLRFSAFEVDEWFAGQLRVGKRRVAIHTMHLTDNGSAR